MSEQHWVEFREGDGEQPAYWAVVSRGRDGVAVEGSAHRVEGEAVMACAELNGRAAADRAYAAGVARAAGAGRLTQKANGIFAEALAAGIDIKPIGGRRGFRPR